MARRLAFAHNPLATEEVEHSAQITQKLRPIFDRGGSTNVRPQSTLKLEWLKPSPTQPRRTFDPSSLEQLKDSIREHGILEPLIVRLRDTHYEIVCGERRYRASRELGLVEVPVTVRDLDDRQAFLLSLHENIHRDGLSPIDEARAYRQMLDSSTVSTHDELAKLLGVSRSRVSQKLALLELPKNIQSLLLARTTSDEGLTERHVRAIRRLSSPGAQCRLALQIVDQHLSVADTESIVARVLDGSPLTDSKPSKPTWIRHGIARYRPTDKGLAVELHSLDPKQQIEALEQLVAILRNALRS